MNLKDVAIIYDFDDTLVLGNSQEYGYIESLNMQKEDFWNEVGCIMKEEHVDRVLAYMYLMHKKSTEQNIPLTKKMLINFGKEVKFLDGVEEWFKRITDYGKQIGLNIHHYIISSGIREMIMGTKIAKEFDNIFACSFLYNDKGEAVWPSIAINYTNKTQFLYRINKGIFDVVDEQINNHMSAWDRFIPFNNMVYIGDGLTDVPCMKLVKEQGGKSIAVYNSDKAREVSENLINEERVNFVSPANYNKDSKIDKYIKEVFKEIINR